MSIGTKSMVELFDGLKVHVDWPDNWLDVGVVSNMFLSHFLVLIVLLIAVNRCAIVMRMKLNKWLFEG